MRDHVWGMNMIFKAWKDDDFYPFACAEEGEIVMDSELLPATTATSGAWEEVRPSGRNSWNMSLSGVLVLEDQVDVMWYSWELFVEAIRKNGLDMEIEYEDIKGNTKTQRGKVYIPQTSNSFRADDFARWMAKLQGSGPLDPTGLLPTPSNTKVVRIDWTVSTPDTYSVQDNRLIGILVNQLTEVSWEGDDKFQIITSGTPTAKQVLLNNITGTLTFLNVLNAGDYIWARVEES